MSNSKDQINLILNKKIYETFSQYKTFIFTTTKEPIYDAFKVMIDNKISSLPVYNEETEQFEKFIDISDIIHHVADIMLENDIKEGFDPSLSQIEFSRYTVGQLAGYSHSNKFLSLKDDNTIRDALKTIVETGVKRIAVKNNSDFDYVITQSFLLSLLSPSLINSHISSLLIENITHDKVLTISCDILMKEAFKLMQEKDYGGVAVIDDDGKIIGNISQSDLKMVGYDGHTISNIMMKIKDILPKQQIISLKINSTFKDALIAFEKEKKHRIYIVDDDKKPIGVLTLMNLLKFINKLVE